MKQFQKWMVVPYDSNYTQIKDKGHPVLTDKKLPSDLKMKLFNDYLTRNILKKNPEKQLPVDSNTNSLNEEEHKEDEPEMYQHLYKNIVDNLEQEFRDRKNKSEIKALKNKAIKNDLQDYFYNSRPIDNKLPDQNVTRRPIKRKSIFDRDTRRKIKRTDKPEDLMNFYNDSLMSIDPEPSQNTRKKHTQFRENKIQTGTNSWITFK